MERGFSSRVSNMERQDENDGGSCGLALSWKADGATCQGRADQNCCLQPKS
jgi:hypothetical protein